jgi:hypothetical protein
MIPATALTLLDLVAATAVVAQVLAVDLFVRSSGWLTLVAALVSSLLAHRYRRRPVVFVGAALLTVVVGCLECVLPLLVRVIRSDFSRWEPRPTLYDGWERVFMGACLGLSVALTLGLPSNGRPPSMHTSGRCSGTIGAGWRLSSSVSPCVE